MTKLTESNLFKVYDTKPETPMDKTTRVVRQMVEEETEQRLAKISRLRIPALKEKRTRYPKRHLKQRAKRDPPEPFQIDDRSSAKLFASSASLGNRHYNQADIGLLISQIFQSPQPTTKINP